MDCCMFIVLVWLYHYTNEMQSPVLHMYMYTMYSSIHVYAYMYMYMYVKYNFKQWQYSVQNVRTGVHVHVCEI